MKIIDASIKIISDSRGKETLEAELKSEDFLAKASVPAGKSTGTHEAFVLEPKKALEKLEEIKSLILDKDFGSQEEFDNFLIELDATENKNNLGGNLILSLSLAFARLKAKSEKKELYKYISDVGGINLTNKFPNFIFNVINGGAHANNKLDFQEFQVISQINDPAIALSVGEEFYRKLGWKLESKFGKENIILGDEAGYSAPFSSNEEALDILYELINEKKYPLKIGLDVAASQFYKDGNYFIDGKKYSARELKNYYLDLIERYNILSIEDPFFEEAFNDFSSLASSLHCIVGSQFNVSNGKLVITDDLTTTNLRRLKNAVDKKSGNAILIKLNQIGSLIETLEVVKFAYQNGWQAIVSHRSGETLDDFIADLAIGVGAWGLKAGAPAKPERLAKYERVLRIQNANIKL